MNQQTALIIGAGPAGLTAAYQLLKETDIYPVIIEADGDIGGISRTHNHRGKRMDIGGHRFFSKNKEITDFWLDICPLQGMPSIDDRLLGREKTLTPGGPDPDRDERVMLLRDRVSRILYLRKFFDYPISMKPATFAAMGLPRTLKAGFGYLHAMTTKREEHTLEDFMINRFGQPLYEMFFKEYNRKVWGVTPADMAPDWGAQRIRGLSLGKALGNMFGSMFRRGGAKETSLIEEFYYPKRGPGQLWECVAADILKMGGDIRLHSTVTGFRLDGSRVAELEIATPGGVESLKGDFIVSSMPVKDLIEALPDAEVPPNVREVAERLPYRDFITVGLLVDGLALRNKTKTPTSGGLVPDCWIYIQEPDVKIGRLQIFNNWSPYMLDQPGEGVWIGLEYFCFEGDEMWEMDDEAFIRFAIDELVKIHVLDSPEAVRDSVRLKVKKAYPAYYGVYERFGEVRDYLDSLDNLYCVGRNGQHRYNNMDHSMLTAMEAVRLIRDGSADKTRLWAVNTEEEYHESSKTEKGGA